MKQVTIRLPDSLWEKAKKAAEKSRRSFNSQMQWLIEQMETSGNGSSATGS